MTATALIELALSKGYAVGRKSRNVYYTTTAVSGEVISAQFFGTWKQFVSYVKAL